MEERLAIHACSLGESIEHIYSLMTNCMVYHVGGRGKGASGGREVRMSVKRLKTISSVKRLTHRVVAAITSLELLYYLCVLGGGNRDECFQNLECFLL